MTGLSSPGARRQASLVVVAGLVLGISACVGGSEAINGEFTVEGAGEGEPYVVRHVSCDGSPAVASYVELIEVDRSDAVSPDEIQYLDVLWRAEAEAADAPIADFVIGTTPEGFGEVVQLDEPMDVEGLDLAVRIGLGDEYEAHYFGANEVQPGGVRSGLSWVGSFEDWSKEWMIREC